MKEIIDWLLDLEQLAGNVYRNAADKFSQDREFSSFLRSLATDEDLHFKLMKDAGEKLLKKRTPPGSDLIIDQGTKDRVEIPLKNLNERISSARRITKQAVLKVIVAVEFAELNNIFQYLVNSFQKDEEDLRRTALTMQAHVERIKKFIKEHTDVLDLSDVVQQLPTLGDEKLLIVENKMPIQIFMAQELTIFGRAETASRGQEALKKVRKNFFRLIITDLDMPVMSGLDFFQRSVETMPGIARNFLFIAREMTPDAAVLCNAYNIAFLRIPFALNQLHKTVRTAINRTK